MPIVNGLDFLQSMEPMRPFVYEAPVEVRGQVFWDCSIGAHTYLNDRGTIREYTDIGRFCSLAHDVMIGASDHDLENVSTHPFATRAVQDTSYTSPYKQKRKLSNRTTIGHDVWIGTQAIVRAGCNLGTGSVLGAGAVLTTDMPPYAIYAGVPAKLIRYRFPPELRLALLESKWWEYEKEDLMKFPTNNIPLFIEQLAAAQLPKAKYAWITY